VRVSRNKTANDHEYAGCVIIYSISYRMTESSTCSWKEIRVLLRWLLPLITWRDRRLLGMLSRHIYDLVFLKKLRKNYISLNRSSAVEADKTRVTRKGLRAHTTLFLRVIRCYLALGPLHIFRRLNVPLFAALHNAIAVTLLDRTVLLLSQLMAIGSIGSLQYCDLQGDSSVRFVTKQSTKRNN